MSKKAGERYTIAVDFDGVIHSYSSPWVAAHIIPDGPVPGAIEWLGQMVQKFNVIIFTTRGKWPWGRWAVRAWLRKHSGGLWVESMGFNGIEEVRVTHKKPAALVYIDDRAWRFTGNFPSSGAIHEARPWNKPRVGRLQYGR